MEIGNGAQPASPTAHIEAELRGLLSEQERVQRGLRDQLAAVDEEARKLRRALAALTGEQATKPRGDRPRPSVPPDKVERVLQAMRELDRPLAPTQIARELDGISPEVARLAIDQLRADGLVRLVGKLRGGGRSYQVITAPAD